MTPDLPHYLGLTPEEHEEALERLSRLAPSTPGQRRRHDCIAAFSSNSDIVVPSKGPGWQGPLADENDLTGDIEALDTAVSLLRQVRSGGGCLFLRESGFYAFVGGDELELVLGLLLVPEVRVDENPDAGQDGVWADAGEDSGSEAADPGIPVVDDTTEQCPQCGSTSFSGGSCPKCRFGHGGYQR